ncbi:MAG: hypothetical protein D6698_01985, partial [Gammaproteobacteria bacterium]
MIWQRFRTVFALFGLSLMLLSVTPASQAATISAEQAIKLEKSKKGIISELGQLIDDGRSSHKITIRGHIKRYDRDLKIVLEKASRQDALSAWNQAQEDISALIKNYKRANQADIQIIQNQLDAIINGLKSGKSIRIVKPATASPKTRPVKKTTPTPQPHKPVTVVESVAEKAPSTASKTQVSSDLLQKLEKTRKGIMSEIDQLLDDGRTTHRLTIKAH